MKTQALTCKGIRARLSSFFERKLSESSWFQEHLAHCPRCRQRMQNLGRIELAISLLKTQPHAADLFARANARAIGVLNNSIRQVPKAEALKTALPEPCLLERAAKYTRFVANLAACLLVICLAKVGIFRAIGTFEQTGQKAVQHYYSERLGPEYANEIFPGSD
jgi:hypothetical protein